MEKTAKTRTIMHLKLLALVLATCVCACAFCACNDATDVGRKTVSVTIGEERITATTDALYLSELLDELKADGKLVSYETSGEGTLKYVTKIGELNPNPENQYVSIYHTIDDITLKGTDWQTGALIVKEYDETAYYYSGVGISALPVKDGAAYLFIIETF